MERVIRAKCINGNQFELENGKKEFVVLLPFLACKPNSWYFITMNDNIGVQICLDE